MTTSTCGARRAISLAYDVEQEINQVRKGQVLMRISNASTGAAIENARTDLVAKRIMLARLDAAEEIRP